MSLLGNGTEEQRRTAWEEIVKLTNKTSGNLSYDVHVDLLKRYGRLIAEYVEIRSTLSQLLLKPDKDSVAFLKRKGFNIETAEGVEKYFQSLNRAITSATNFGSKIKSAYNEIANLAKQDVSSVPATLGQLIASVNIALDGPYMNANTLLSEYNEYKNIIHKKLSRHNGRNK